MNLPNRRDDARSLWLAGSLCAAATLSLTAAFHWPLPLHLTTWEIGGAFHRTHLWAFDHIARMVTGELPWSTTTDRVAWPAIADVRFIVWLPSLLAVPLRSILGPLGAYNLVVLLSPVATALVTWVAFRRLFASPPFVAAAAATTYALSPFALGSIANGQTAKFQLWALPMFLLALDAALRRPRGLLLVALVTLVVTFTSPTLALQFPFIGVVWIIAEAARRRPHARRVLLMGALAMGVAGASMLPARAYFSVGDYTDQALPDGTTAPIPIFEPAHVSDGGEGIKVDAENVAELEDAIYGTALRRTQPTRTNHISYLSLVLLGVVSLLALYPFERRGSALALAITGFALALGPIIHKNLSQTHIGEHVVPGPAILLVWAHYPLSASGTWYRLVAMASLGLSAAFAGGMAVAPRRWRGLLAWTILAVFMVDAHRSLGKLWPRPVWPFADRERLQEMAEDPVPGAVLDIPIYLGPHAGNAYMADAIFHQRTTSGMPRPTFRSPTTDELADTMRQAMASGDPDTAKAELASVGLRYVVFHTDMPPTATRSPIGGTLHISEAELEAGLGPGEHSEHAVWWRLPAP